MNFITAMAQAMRTRKTKANRRKGTQAYLDGNNVRLSRLMGYMFVDGRYIPDAHAGAITLIFEMLGSGASVYEVKKALDDRKERDSSKALYSYSRILGLVRPIYSAHLERNGRMITLSNVQPLVTLAQYRAAAKQAKEERKKLLRQ